MVQQQEEKMEQLKRKLEEAKNLRYKAEVRLEELERQEQEILGQLAQLNVNPEDLAEEISKLEKEINEQVAEAWSLIPQELNTTDDSIN